jgi:hypothetical protein
MAREKVLITYTSTAADYCYSAYEILSNGVPSPSACQRAAEELRRAAELVGWLAAEHRDTADLAVIVAKGVAAQMTEVADGA